MALEHVDFPMVNVAGSLPAKLEFQHKTVVGGPDYNLCFKFELCHHCFLLIREGCRRKNLKNYGVNRTTVHQPPVAVLKGMLYTMLYCILCIYGISYNIISYTLIYLHVKQRRLVVVC